MFHKDHEMEQAAASTVAAVFGDASGHLPTQSQVTTTLEQLQYAMSSDTTWISHQEHHLMGMTVLLATGHVRSAKHAVKALLHLQVPEEKIREAATRLAFWIGGVTAMERIYHVNAAIREYRAESCASVPGQGDS